MRVDTSSSSASVTAAGVTGRSDAPDIASRSSVSTVASSSGVRVNVPVPLAAFAGMVIVEVGNRREVRRARIAAAGHRSPSPWSPVAAGRGSGSPSLVTGVGPSPSDTRPGTADSRMRVRRVVVVGQRDRGQA